MKNFVFLSCGREPARSERCRSARGKHYRCYDAPLLHCGIGHRQALRPFAGRSRADCRRRGARSYRYQGDVLRSRRSGERRKLPRCKRLWLRILDSAFDSRTKSARRLGFARAAFAGRFY